MRKLVRYIFIMSCLLASCQMMELSDESPSVQQEGTSLGKATISFSVSAPIEHPTTKKMGDSADEDIKNLYLLVFDEMGYLVEYPKAKLKSFSTHEGHPNERKYEVELSLTDKPRTIHFIANCPEDQIKYGDEKDVISNMYVTKGGEIETSYWYRVDVPYIMKKDEVNLTDEIAPLFTCVPLLRNYAQITVVASENLNSVFKLESFAVYNDINLGTVAPYNKTSESFQMFHNSNGLLSYDELLEEGFEGNAVAKAELNRSLDESDFISPGYPFYMYERKVSVRTQNEEEWNESPPHIIIKGKYLKDNDGKEEGVPSTYYKVDLVRVIAQDNQYFNILRNFKYIFTIKSISGHGYDSWGKAMEKPAGNNLSGAADTQGYKNISDGVGRIFVSFTDTTLVSTDNITLKYRYIPNISYETADIAANDRVNIQHYEGSGNVLKDLVEKKDSTDGWTYLTFSVQDIPEIRKDQIIKLHVSDNPNLHKTIRFALHRPLVMSVLCNPTKIFEGVGEEMNVKINIPDDLTSSYFPLDIRIEVDKLTLGPNTDKGTSLPVDSGKSIIAGKTSKQSFYYTYTLEEEDYKILPPLDGKKTISTDWLTSSVKSASKVYAYNKYFNLSFGEFFNASNAFTGLTVNPSPIFYGEGATVSVAFTMDNDDTDYAGRSVTVRLNGLKTANGDTKLTIPLAGQTNNVSISGRTVTISNLKTTSLDKKVSFSLDNNSYVDITSAEVDRKQGAFKDLTINPGTIFYGKGQPVSISFKLDDADVNYASRTIKVKLNGLELEGQSEVDVRMSGNTNSNIQINNKTVTITNLLTNSISFAASFSLEEQCYAPIDSPVANRERFEFVGPKFSVSPVPRGIGQTVDISFSKDVDDALFNTREITIELEGLVTAEGRDEITILNPSNQVTIEGLKTTTDRGAVSFKVTTTDSAYDPVTVTESRPKGKFTDLKFEPNELPATQGTGVQFKFNIPEEDYYGGMEVLVTTEGLVDDDSNLETVATRASYQYKYSPSTFGLQTLNLKMGQDGSGNECSVSIVDEEGYFEEASITKTQKPNTITIPAGKLITNINRNNGFANGGTIYIFTRSDYSGSSVGYKYKRSQNSYYNNGKATNSSDITLSGVTTSDKLYIQYQNDTRTYRGTFTLSDALDNDGVTITLTQQ